MNLRSHRISAWDSLQWKVISIIGQSNVAVAMGKPCRWRSLGDNSPRNGGFSTATVDYRRVYQRDITNVVDWLVWGAPPNNFSLLNNRPFFWAPPPSTIFLNWFQFTFNWNQFTFNWFQFTFNWFQLISIYFQFTFNLLSIDFNLISIYFQLLSIYFQLISIYFQFTFNWFQFTFKGFVFFQPQKLLGTIQYHPNIHIIE